MLNTRVVRNIKAKNQIQSSKANRRVIKYILRNCSNLELKKQLVVVYSKYNHWHATKCNKNLCIVSGKSRSVYRFCKLSRMQIKKYAGLRLLSGLRPSSW